MPIRLADTTIRLYRKKDGKVSARLHSFLMVHAKNRGFRLSTYLTKLTFTLTLDSGERIELDDYQYTYDCLYRFDHMIHELWACGTVPLETMKNTAGLLRVEHLLFASEKQATPTVTELVVPVLARGRKSLRWSSQPHSAA